MFRLLRVLFILIVVAWAFCYWQERRTGKSSWRQARIWVSRSGLGLLGLMVVGLFVQRLLG